MTTGEKLRELRGNERREVVAAAVGVSVSALAMYETDKRVPRDDVKARISAFYDVPVQDIFFVFACHNS